MVKVTGEITVSFPASILPLIYDTENAPLLSFLVRGTSCLEQILPNKALINRCDDCGFHVTRCCLIVLCPQLPRLLYIESLDVLSYITRCHIIYRVSRCDAMCY